MLSIETFSNKKIGIVLSGGGVKGLAHIGVLEALVQNGISPVAVSGVSAGAIIGALYANGNTTKEMLSFFKETPLFRYTHFSINKPGFFDTEKYNVFFNEYFPNNSFESLNKKLTVVATNLEKGQYEFFDKGPLLKPLLASAALPPVFSPVKLNDQLYADGAIMNNYPIEPLQGCTEFIIGCYTSSMKPVDAKALKNSVQLSQRTNLLMLHANVAHRLLPTDLLFTPEGLETIGTLDKRGIDKAYKIGYDYACQRLEKG